MWGFVLPLSCALGHLQQCGSVVSLWGAHAGASPPGCTVLPAEYSVPADSLTEGLNQPIQSTPSHSPQTLLTLLFMSLKFHFFNTCNCSYPSAKSPGHGKDWKSVSEDEGRRRCWHHRRRRTGGGESFSPQPALSTRNTSWR